MRILTLDRILSAVLIAAVAGALVALGYVVSRPPSGELFTEFYILGANGLAADYPEEMQAGDTATVTVGIVNHEGKAVSYVIEIRINGVTNGRTTPIPLAAEGKWEGPVNFRPASAGSDEKVEFFLYEDNKPEPSMKPVFLLVNVKSGS